MDSLLDDAKISGKWHGTENDSDAYRPRKCRQCRRSFLPKRIGGRHKGIFCSRECFHESIAKWEKCKVCEKSFRPRCTGQVYCSNNCKKQNRASMSGSKNPSWKGGKITVFCAYCGARIFKHRSLMREKNFCSRKCHDLHKVHNSTGRNNPNWRGGELIKTCRNCDRSYKVIRARYAESVYCSKKCFNEGSFAADAPRYENDCRWGRSGSKAGMRKDIGIYVRSSWEANYARYLNSLLNMGRIKSWQYEPKTFQFSGQPKGGRHSYTPDFCVVTNAGTRIYVEVKGWMDTKSKRAIDLMISQYPDVCLHLVLSSTYNWIRSRYSYENWE